MKIFLKKESPQGELWLSVLVLEFAYPRNNATLIESLKKWHKFDQ